MGKNDEKWEKLGNMAKSSKKRGQVVKSGEKLEKVGKF